MIIIKIIILYFIQIRHTDDCPSTGTRVVLIIHYSHILCVLSVVGFESCPAVIVDASNVPEMTEVRVTEQGVVFGASVTLSTMEEFLQETIEHLPGRFTLVH